MKRIAVDANLLLLLVVGSAAPEFVHKHKRLKAYLASDYDLLTSIVERPDRIVATPNALTEVSNLMRHGVQEPLQTKIVRAFQALVGQLDERYQPSRKIIRDPDFLQLRLADCAWLDCLDADTELITADLPLYLVAISRGHAARKFTHLRDLARET